MYLPLQQARPQQRRPSLTRGAVQPAPPLDGGRNPNSKSLSALSLSRSLSLPTRPSGREAVVDKRRAVLEVRRAEWSSSMFAKCISALHGGSMWIHLAECLPNVIAARVIFLPFSKFLKASQGTPFSKSISVSKGCNATGGRRRCERPTHATVIFQHYTRRRSRT